MRKAGIVVMVIQGLMGSLAFTNKEFVIASVAKQSRTMPFSLRLPRYGRDDKRGTNIDTNNWPSKFGFGRAANQTEIAAWDIDIRPDGKGLPVGQGSVHEGRAIYIQKCVACHGEKSIGQVNAKTLGPALIGDTILKVKEKTIGNYWPYATTLFDYIRRAMPYPQPGSLSNTEIYSLTAYLLNVNHVTADTVQNASSLPKIIMPARKLFVFDDRRGGSEVK
ncbi:c-type cytochrome [Mucilaginibacter ximonensis]|uniref:C-type cytochrome n=1 Tax=Mucilaginibacter ximonensis TaxID=538021 RepID=A0ABW5Y6E1_9SPHI